MLHVNSRQVGKRYEKMALAHLQSAGLVFVAANVQYRFGEIDLIMQDQQTLVFIEVRFRRSSRFGGAVPSITQRKRQRLLHAAGQWLMERDLSLETADCRFDIFAITGNQVEWFQNAINEDNLCH